MSEHKDEPNARIHAPYRVIFANDAARTGDAGSYSAGDVTARIKALQEDTKQEYVLTAVTPTWTAVGGGGGGVADTTVDNTVQTTTAAVATAATHTTTTNNRVIKIRTTVFARENATDDIIQDVIETVANRDNVGAVTVKDNSHVAVYKDQAPWNVTLDVSGSDIRVRVTGEAGKTIEWRAQMEVSEHG
jgi:hypothetical protein